jgi:hypothetical protein
VTESADEIGDGNGGEQQDHRLGRERISRFGVQGRVDRSDVQD